MVNTDITKEVVDIFRVDTLVEPIPNSISVVEAHPRLVTPAQIVKHAQASNNADTTIYQTTAVNTFYLTSASLTMVRDANATSTLHRIRITVDDGTPSGALVEILSIPGITLTAGSATISISLPRPIKLIKNSYISLMSTNAVGNFSLTATITGFYLTQ